MSKLPSDKEQPSNGNILTLHSSSKYACTRMSNATSQAILNRKRRQFLASLPQDHALRERVFIGTGELVRDRHQPNGRPRDIASSPEQVKSRRKSKKSREDAEGTDWLLERNRFLGMWNGIGERATREEEWVEFDRVKPKLLRLKRKHYFLDCDLHDEKELDRKRAKSRRRSQRDNTKGTPVSDGNQVTSDGSSRFGYWSNSQDRHHLNLGLDLSKHRWSPKRRNAYIDVPPAVTESLSNEDEDEWPVRRFEPLETIESVESIELFKSIEDEAPIGIESFNHGDDDGDLPIHQLPAIEPAKAEESTSKQECNDDGNGCTHEPRALKLTKDDSSILIETFDKDDNETTATEWSASDQNGIDRSIVEALLSEPARHTTSVRTQKVDAVETPAASLSKIEHAWCRPNPEISASVVPVLRRVKARIRRDSGQIPEGRRVSEERGNSAQSSTEGMLCRTANTREQFSHSRASFDFTFPPPTQNKPAKSSRTRLGKFVNPWLQNLPDNQPGHRQRTE